MNFKNIKLAKRIYFFLIFICFIPSSYAENSFWGGHSKGWHWYQNQKLLHKDKKEQKTSPISRLSATEQMSIVQKVAITS